MRDNENAAALHYVFRAAMMLGFAFYIVHLVKVERLVYYVAPRMQVYVKCAGVALFVIALFQLFLAWKSYLGQEKRSCGCSHAPQRPLWKSSATYGLFLFPLLLGFALPDTIMGSDIVAVKGMNLSSSGAVKPTSGLRGQSVDRPSGQGRETADQLAGGTDADRATEPGAGGGEAEQKPSAKLGQVASSAEDGKLESLFQPNSYNTEFIPLAKKLYAQRTIRVKEEGFMEMLTTLDLFMDAFVGKTVEISGFVYREDGMAADQFVVSRMAMLCCSADSSPYGILTVSPGAKNLSKDAWVTVKGTIGKTTYSGQEIMKIDAASVETMAPPKEPYVYPYFGDFVRLAD